MDLYLPECTPNFIEALRPTIEFQTDKYWSCETAKLARSWSTRSVGRTYLYRFSYAPPLDLLLYYPQGSFGFAAHAADLMVSVQ
jgi:carboxylesterase type B